MAITAKFDLETRQLDAINAFTNSVLDEDVYVQFPDGYRRRGWAGRSHMFRIDRGCHAGAGSLSDSRPVWDTPSGLRLALRIREALWLYPPR